MIGSLEKEALVKQIKQHLAKHRPAIIFRVRYQFFLTAPTFSLSGSAYFKWLHGF
jgi:hypothetical protein